MVVISDSSSIIALNRVGKLDILKNLYGKIIIPKAVEREITSDHKKRINLDRLFWIVTRSLKQPLCATVLSTDIGPGESEAISLALELKANLLILDETATRIIARRLELKFTGTLGILLKAKGNKFIPSIKNLLDDLIKCDFRISSKLYNDILELAKEK